MSFKKFFAAATLMAAWWNAWAAGGFATMPTSVSIYPQLSPLQWRVSQAYLATMGRIPDASPASTSVIPNSTDSNMASFCATPAQNGLDYWYCQVYTQKGAAAPSATVADVVETEVAPQI